MATLVESAGAISVLPAAGLKLILPKCVDVSFNRGEVFFC